MVEEVEVTGMEVVAVTGEVATEVEAMEVVEEAETMAEEEVEATTSVTVTQTIEAHTVILNVLGKTMVALLAVVATMFVASFRTLVAVGLAATVASPMTCSQGRGSNAKVEDAMMIDPAHRLPNRTDVSQVMLLAHLHTDSRIHSREADTARILCGISQEVDEEGMVTLAVVVIVVALSLTKPFLKA